LEGWQTGQGPAAQIMLMTEFIVYSGCAKWQHLVTSQPIFTNVIQL